MTMTKVEIDVPEAIVPYTRYPNLSCFTQFHT